MARAEQVGDTFAYRINDIACRSCGTEEWVIAIGSPDGIPLCIMCTMYALDAAMEWNLAGVALQAIVQRNTAALKEAERDRITKRVPPNLRPPPDP